MMPKQRRNTRSKIKNEKQLSKVQDKAKIYYHAGLPEKAVLFFGCKINFQG
jgi:hypothetical protein